LIHVVFDIDGTVIDHRRRMYGLYVEYATSHALPVLDVATYFGRKRGGADERAVATETFPVGSVDEYLRWKRERIEASDALAEDTLIAGMREVLAEFAATSPLAAVSARQSRSLLVEELTRLGVGAFFRETVVVDGAKAAAIEDYARRAGVAPAALVVVGDTEVEIGAAKAVGCRCVAVTWGLRGRDFLERNGAPLVVDSVSELVSALHGLGGGS
jgi:phosphoglycolate phosphatase-like HAD superfamily hydrolase